MAQKAIITIRVLKLHRTPSPGRRNEKHRQQAPGPSKLHPHTPQGVREASSFGSQWASKKIRDRILKPPHAWKLGVLGTPSALYQHRICLLLSDMRASSWKIREHVEIITSGDRAEGKASGERCVAAFLKRQTVTLLCERTEVGTGLPRHCVLVSWYPGILVTSKP